MDTETLAELHIATIFPFLLGVDSVTALFQTLIPVKLRAATKT